MKHSLRVLLCVLSTLFAGSVLAQDQAPRGPADVLTQAREQIEASEREEQVAAGAASDVSPTTPTSEAATNDAAPNAAPQATNAAQRAEERQRELARRATGQNEPLTSSQASTRVPVGTIRVQVVDSAGRPAGGTAVRIGIMRSAGSRDAINGETDSLGIATFADLPTGSAQSYRVSVTHDGAKYGATPFRLEPDRGHLVRIRRLDTTRERRTLLQTLGQTIVEFREDRVHITEQASLTNLGEETIVLPEEGLAFELPEGFMAFQTEAMMSDQRLVAGDEGFALHGSLPPGRTLLTWGFDLPLEGETIRFSHPIPVRTYTYRVIVDSALDLDVDVVGFPRMQRLERGGRGYLVTEVERGPEDAELEELNVVIRGVPGPGPARWVAVGAAIVFLMLAFMLVTRGGDRAAVIAEAREERKAEILEEAAELALLAEKGEVGPKFRERRLVELTDELAGILKGESQST